jgi:hypothetical protein
VEIESVAPKTFGLHYINVTARRRRFDYTEPRIFLQNSVNSRQTANGTPTASVIIG